MLSHKHIVIKSTKMCSWCWNSRLPGATVGTGNRSDVVACQLGPPHWPDSQCINPPFVKIHRSQQLPRNISLCVVCEQTFYLSKSMNEEFGCLPHSLLFCSSTFGFRPASPFSVSLAAMFGSLPCWLPCSWRSWPPWLYTYPVLHSPLHQHVLLETKRLLQST